MSFFEEFSGNTPVYLFVLSLSLGLKNEPVYKSEANSTLLFFQSYEGTGRSLSLKLIKQLEEQNQISSRSVETAVSGFYSMS